MTGGAHVTKPALQWRWGLLLEADLCVQCGFVCVCVCVCAARFKFYRFDISLQLLDGPSVLNYMVGLVGGQAPLASHTISLPARCAA